MCLTGLCAHLFRDLGRPRPRQGWALWRGAPDPWQRPRISVAWWRMLSH